MKRRAIRVLHINTERTWRGGEQQTLYLMEGLAARGIPQLLVAQRKGALVERARAKGLPVLPLRMRGEADPFAIATLLSLLRERRISILHAHTSHAHSLGALAAALRGRVRVLVARRVDFSIFRRSFFGLNRIKYVHGVDRYATVSRAIKDVLLADGLPEPMISVVHSGIDLARIDDAPNEREQVRRDLDIPPGDFLVANVAHMADHKGQIYLVDAVPLVLAKVPNATFAIVGDGERRGPLEARARELGVAARVRFPGFREDVPTILKALDLFVMPSHMEGLGTSVLDAMAAGAPVVGTEAGGMTEMLEHGKNALVCPVRDARALAVAITDLLTDREKARRFAGEARRTVVERFSKEAMVEKTVRVYEDLLA